jgi:putative ABC transport system permease protein
LTPFKEKIVSLLIRLAYRNVKNHWRQSLAALISVSTGFTAFALFDGYLLDVYRAMTEMTETLDMRGDVIIERVGASEPEGRSHPWDWALSADDQTNITKYLADKNSKVLAYSRFLKIDGSIDTSETSFVFYGFGYDIKGGSLIQGRWHWNTYWGKPLVEQSDYSQFMVLGRRLSQYIGCLPDQLGNLSKYFLDLELRPIERPFQCVDKSFQLTTVTEKGQVNAIDMAVSGIYDQGFREFDERLVVLPIEAAQNLFDTDKVNYFAVKLKEGVSINQFVEDFRNSFNASAVKLNIEPWQTHVFGDVFRRTKSLLDVDRAFVISIIIFVGCLSVFNTLVKIIKERTFEIGMLRSLGFESSFIKKLFVLEAIFLSWLGCIIGIILSIILSILINKIEITYPSGLFSYDIPLRIMIQISTYWFGLLMMTGLSVVAAFIAIRKPSQGVIAQTLIHV